MFVFLLDGLFHGTILLRDTLALGLFVATLLSPAPSFIMFSANDYLYELSGHVVGWTAVLIEWGGVISMEPLRLRVLRVCAVFFFHFTD
jgi:hypothetical protein